MGNLSHYVVFYPCMISPAYACNFMWKVTLLRDNGWLGHKSHGLCKQKGPIVVLCFILLTVFYHNSVSMDVSISSLYYGDIMMSAISSQITSVLIVCSTVFACADQRKYQSSASLAFVRGIHKRQVDSLYKGPVTLKMFDVYIRFQSWYNGFATILCTWHHDHAVWSYAITCICCHLMTRNWMTAKRNFHLNLTIETPVIWDAIALTITSL